jgi:hypothetical protein
MAKEEPELFDTEIRAAQVGHSIPCVGGFAEGFEHVGARWLGCGRRAGIYAPHDHRMLTTRSVPTSLVSSLRDSSVMMSDPPIHNRSEIRLETSTGNSIRSSALAGSGAVSSVSDFVCSPASR